MKNNKDNKSNEYEVFEKSERSLREEKILDFWDENDIFHKSIVKDAPEGDYVFYEGPPTANGRPGIHHLESRAFKDAFPRYKTMQGFRVARRGGWDTHGLPVELEVEKELGLKSKKEVEDYGIEKFNEKCKESVWKYVNEWEAFTRRSGYWVDLDNPYVTYKNDYIESVWNVFSFSEKRGLLYKDYKVVPWCPRCGTALSSHELAQGYEDIKELSVIGKFELLDDPGTFILAWTTTPWTLPGNVGLAVGREIDYVIVVFEGYKYIVAKERLSEVFTGKEFEIIKEIKGRDLMGRTYKPLYDFLANEISSDDNRENAFKVWEADFVTTEDGTGVVHTAVMYGQEDFDLGTAVGLPKKHLVKEDGCFNDITGWLKGKFVKDEETTIEIVKDLAGRGLLFAKKKYEHNYPHCWRCKTPLIYYARDSWYIRMSALRDELITENEKINWEPEHIKEGRFGDWLSGVKDWAISRERYFGTPLPIWERVDGKGYTVVDSFEKMRLMTKKSGNKYLVMRHGQADNNNLKKYSSDPNYPHHITLEGREQIIEQAKKLKEKEIDLILVSPFVRTRETAELLSEQLGLDSKHIIIDNRLSETNFGDFNGKDVSEAIKYFSGIHKYKFLKSYPNGENSYDVKKRVMELLYELECKYENKNILLVTHSDPAWLMLAGSMGLNEDKTWILRNSQGEGSTLFKTGDFKEIDFVPLPHNKDYEFDVHKPFIDDLVLYDKDGVEMRRVPEVMDVWFDSGAMPFAQDHYPFENKDLIDNGGYPAEFIAEAIDQTRGWFYTLHAIGVLTGRGRAYKNVISLGHLMDAEGQKMSKSKGNVIVPWKVFATYGADVARFWMYSVNQPGDSKNFDDRTVTDVARKFFGTMDNVVSFYELFADEKIDFYIQSENVLDKWIKELLIDTNIQITKFMNSYKVMEATRLLRDFVLELSQWYVRRSRDRFKGDDENDKKLAQGTLGWVILETAKMMAPFAPFASEEIWQKLRNSEMPESVHLAKWSEFDVLTSGVLEEMNKVREVVTLALEARDKAGIKVRQPLAKLVIKQELTEEYRDIIADEVNVEDVAVAVSLEEEVKLDTELNDDLKNKGVIRELLRNLQSQRKKLGLVPDDKVTVQIETSDVGKTLVKKFKEELVKVAGVDLLEFIENEGQEIFEHGYLFKVLVKKV